MFQIIRNGGNGRVQSGFPCARAGEASAKHPNIRSEISFDGIVAPFYPRRWQRPDSRENANTRRVPDTRSALADRAVERRPAGLHDPPDFPRAPLGGATCDLAFVNANTGRPVRVGLRPLN